MTRYLHTMIRVTDPDATIRFFELIGLKEVRRVSNDKGRFTLIFLAAPGDEGRAEVELTHNWDAEEYTGGRNFGHLAYAVDDIYATCQRLLDAGSRSTVLPATGTWRSSGRPTESPSNCCRTGCWSRASRGRACPTSAPGRTSAG